MSRISTYPNPAAPASTPPAYCSGEALDNFPIDAFPIILKTVAGNLAEVYQTPTCLPAMAALAVLSGAVGKSVVVSGGYKDKATRLNLYVIATAERGSGKDNVGETLVVPISCRSRELMEQHRKMVPSTRSEMGLMKREIARLEQQAAGSEGNERANALETLNNRQERLALLEGEAGRKIALIVGNATGEAMARDLADNGEALFSYSAEAGALVKVALGKYSAKDEADFDLLLSAYSGGFDNVSRITRQGVMLESPCLALLWLMQPSVARKLMADEEALSRGLTARPLIFDSKARREHDDRKNLPFAHAGEWKEFIDRILDYRLSNAASKQRVIECSPEAKEIFARFHDESVDLERNLLADLVGELSRWRENAIKVAGLFALTGRTQVVTAEHAQNAAMVVRWCGFNYLGLRQSGQRERLGTELRQVVGLLRDSGGELNFGDLQKRHGLDRGRIEALVGVFPADLAIERRRHEGPGRPAEILKLTAKSSLSTKSLENADKVDLVDLPAVELSPNGARP